MKATRMKECYFDVGPDSRDTRTIIDLHQLSPHVWRIARVNTPWQVRHQGHATRMMLHLLADANHDRVDLVLEPLATGADMDGLDTDQLIRWYESLGFYLLKDGTMIRPRLVNKGCHKWLPQ